MNKQIFLTAYGDRKKIITPSGEKIEPVYEYVINSKGQKVLEQTGETNIYEKIQECLEETKIENILARAMQGDNSVFRPDGIYADTTQVPSNLIEARQMIQQLENTWLKVPREIKEKYNNDMELFISQSGSNEWLKDMGIIPNNSQAEVKIETIKEQPKEGENKT